MFILSIIVFFDLVGFGMILPMIPVFTHNYNLDPLHVGILASSFFFTNFFGSLIIGYISDLWHRKKTLLVCTVCLVLSYFFMGFLQTIDHSFVMLIIMRGFIGFFSGNMAVIFAMVANLSNKENIAKNMAIVGGGLTLGFIFGPALGGWLTNSYDSVTPFYYTAICYGLCFFLLLFLVKEPPIEISSASQNIWKMLIQLLSNTKIIIFLSLFILLNFAFAGLEVFLLTQTLSVKLKQPPILVGTIWTYFAIVLTIVQFTCYKLFAPRAAIIGGFALFSLSILGLVFANSLLVIFVLITVLAFASGILFPNVNASLSLAGAPKQQGTVFGINQSSQAIGAFLGPYILSFIYSLSGTITMVWITIFIVLAIGAIAAALFLGKDVDNSTPNV